MANSTLPLSEVVDVVVQVSPQNPASPTFNQGLIVGTSNTIPSVTGSNPRLRLYTSLSAMTADGFSVLSPEYIAASMYFGQTVPPLYLWIGRQDLTAIAAANIHNGVAGTGYVVGDIVTVVQSGASLGELLITAVNAGVPTALQLIPGSQGTGYSAANALTTTGGTGTGLEVDITAIGETPLQAVQACRAASTAWYTVCALAAFDADHIAIAEWAQTATPQCCYFYTTGTTAALNGAVGSVFAALKAGTFSRAFGIYSTTSEGLYPDNIYSQAAAMGVAMGLNTGLANSYFTMKFKRLVGIYPESLTQTQISVLEANNANVYLSFANSYAWLEQGTVGDGQFFDQILNLDMLSSNIQYGLVGLLVGNNVIPQTDAGQTQILNIVNQACALSVTIGFLARAVWAGASIPSIGLVNGQALPSGYYAGSPKYSTQLAADKDARKSMPVYVAVCQAGAVHSILIGVYVQS